LGENPQDGTKGEEDETEKCHSREEHSTGFLRGHVDPAEAGKSAETGKLNRKEQVNMKRRGNTRVLPQFPFI